MDKERFCDRPMLDLIENTGPRVDECKNISRNDTRKNIRSAETEIIECELYDQKNDAANYRAETSEHHTSDKKFFHITVFSHFKPILSLTVFT